MTRDHTFCQHCEKYVHAEYSNYKLINEDISPDPVAELELVVCPLCDNIANFSRYIQFIELPAYKGGNFTAVPSLMDKLLNRFPWLVKILNKVLTVIGGTYIVNASDHPDYVDSLETQIKDIIGLEKEEDEEPSEFLTRALAAIKAKAELS